MKLVTARDLESADLLALAQLDDNGAHCLAVPVCRARMIAAAPGRARWQLTPAVMGVG